MRPGDVVLVPFPFTDIPVKKRRPAVVVSTPKYYSANKHIVCAMVTSAKRSKFLYDVVLRSPGRAGLPKSCLVRFKLFTLHESLILEELGKLDDEDWKLVRENLLKVVG